MVYQGGKFFQRKYILPIIEETIVNNNIKNYYEPFVGGCNVIQKISNTVNRYGNDIDDELIEFYKYITMGGSPLDDISKELFFDMKDNPDKYEKWQLGGVKIMGSFGAKGFKAGFGGIDKRSGKTHYQRSINSFKKQIPFLHGINFTSVDYRELEIQDRSFVYCDPPYRNTTEYYDRNFNHQDYDNWIKWLSNKCYVLCSEYNMPDDFICIKEIPIRKKLPKDNNKAFVIDKLYIYKEGLMADYLGGKNE